MRFLTKSLNMMSHKKITKSNFLIQAQCKLTLFEHHLILACLAKIDPRKAVPSKMTLSASEFANSLCIDLKNAYRELYEASERLYDRTVVSVDNDEMKVEFRWIQKKIFYKKGDGSITIEWSTDALSRIGDLRDRFTSYSLPYSIRLYELLIQFNSTKMRRITLKEFRFIFDLERKYPLFKDLNKKVIKPAIDEINQHSNLLVSFKPIRDGRKIVTLQFDFQDLSPQKT